ncbi:hypothetical protein [Rhodococcus sp. JVH1]|nr:hypothetical protein [Rhodococcus sp. JVH1]EJJ01233.1 hypothetical protein JVH1_1236 [Rhodococcus sp. JVH1]
MRQAVEKVAAHQSLQVGPNTASQLPEWGGSVMIQSLTARFDRNG